MLYYTEQTPEIDVVNGSQNSEGETTNKPSSADDGTLSRDSAQQKDLQPCYDITPEE